jgi:phage virion morphogenesis protein
MSDRESMSAGGGGAEQFSPLVDALDDLAARIDAPARKTLGRAIATDLRTANARRIRANAQPDGEAMTPRKKQGGHLRSGRLRDPASRAKRSVRTQRMFARAGQPRYLRKESTTGDAQVGFVGAMARIMRVHQYGLRDTVTRDPASPAVTYPERVVLGLDHDDRARILDRLTEQVAP